MKINRTNIEKAIYNLFTRNVIHRNLARKRIAAFISIPKNGSKAVLENLKLGKNRALENTSSLVIFENHQRAAVMAERFNFEELFTFCFVRNPYDRSVSWYEFHRNMEPYKSLTFREWVKEGMPHHWVIQNRTDYLSEGISPLLQHSFVQGAKIDFIGKMENFPTDLDHVVENLNRICAAKQIRYSFTYSHHKVNSSKRSNRLADYYDGVTADLVHATLRSDFEVFGYSREFPSVVSARAHSENPT